MVEHRAVERFGGGGETAGRATVALAGASVAAWVVVSENDSRAAMNRRIGDDRAERKFGADRVAFMSGDVKAAGIIVDMRHPQILSRRIRIGDAAGEEGTGRGNAVESQREFGTLITHACNL